MVRGDRLADRMKALGLSQSELARRVGVSQASIWKLINEPAQGSKFLHKIASAVETNAAYLMGETDDPEPNAVPVLEHVRDEPDDDLVEIDSIDLAYGMGGTFLDTEYIAVEKVKMSHKWLRQFTKSPPSMLCSTRGMGDSMMPTIHDQDVVIIDRSQTTPEMGDKIWALVFSGWGMIKRLRAQPDGTIRISSDNQLVRDDFAAQGDMFIVGRVIAVVKSV